MMGERYGYSSSELLSLILTNLGWKPRVHGSSDPSNAAFMRAGCEKYRSVTLDGLRFCGQAPRRQCRGILRVSAPTR